MSQEAKIAYSATDTARHRIAIGIDTDRFICGQVTAQPLTHREQTPHIVRIRRCPTQHLPARCLLEAAPRRRISRFNHSTNTENPIAA